jgi:hypothetical protein
MRRRQISKRLLIPLFLGMVALLLSGCIEVTIQDHTIYVDMGSLGAHSRTTLSNQSQDISKSQWDDMRIGMLCMTPDTYADWKEVIEKLCSKSNTCKYQITPTVKAVDTAIRESRYTGG